MIPTGLFQTTLCEPEEIDRAHSFSDISSSAKITSPL